jgi:hypothetical protein
MVRAGTMLAHTDACAAIIRALSGALRSHIRGPAAPAARENLGTALPFPDPPSGHRAEKDMPARSQQTRGICLEAFA